ncbi:MAG: hypothetical protein H6823_10200 [Planctomycetaceae bacterium]|nr:hypothetical protein [Planctomycetaceae bacterium]
MFRLLAQIAELAWLPKGDGKSSCGYRLHAQFEVFKGTPSRIDVTGANPKGEADERRVLEEPLSQDVVISSIVAMPSTCCGTPSLRRTASMCVG